MNVQEHYTKRRELDLLEEYDNTRKQLIRLAVMKVVAVAAGAQQAEKPANSAPSEELIKKCHNYELTINKLKQDWNTKEKLSESRIEKLKDDLSKARSQSKGGFQQPSYMAPINKSRTDLSSRTNLTLNKSPYLARPGSRMRDRNPDLFSPIAPRQGERRGKYQTSATFKQFHQQQLANRNNQNVIGTPRGNLSTKLQLDRAMTNRMSPNKSPSRLSFIENFDKSDPSKSPSPDFTPSKAGPSARKQTTDILPDSFSKDEDAPGKKDNKQDQEPEGPDANSTAISEDADPRSQSADQSSGTEDVFASANSSLGSVSIISKGSQERAKGKTRLLNLAGSLKGKTERTVSRGLNIEQDGLNSLDYYKDTNFTEGNEESPNFKRHQTADQPSFERKKKKVFKVT